MTFTYNRDIPDAPNNPSNDQPLMKVNTNSADDLLAVDHFSFNVAKGGTHKQVTLTNEAAPGIGSSDGVLYSNGNFPAWQNGAGQTSFFAGFPSATSNGYAFLQGGVIIQWGVFTITGQTNTVLFITSNINFPNNCWNVQATLIPAAPPTGNAQTISINSISSSGFIANYSGGSAYGSFYWFAIGN